MNWPFGELPHNHFGAIVSDPPWRFRTWSETNQKKSASRYYGLMTLDQIGALPVGDLAAKDCALFLWVINPMIPHALRVMDAWGFCVGVGTRVLTRDLRWAAAEDLRPGDALLGFDDEVVGDRRYYRPSTVLSTGIEYLESCRVTLQTGETLIASEDHPWLAQHQNKNGHPSRMRWVKTKELLKLRPQGGGVPPVPVLPRVAPVCVADLSYESGFLAGAFDAEGSIAASKGGIRFSQNDNALMAAVKDALKRRSYDFSLYDRSAADNCNQIYLRGGLRELMRFMMECRPPRLLEKWQTQNLVSSLYNLEKVRIEAVERIGLRPCVTLMTDTGTYIAEGFGAHNTYKTVAFTWAKTTTRTDWSWAPKWHAGLGYWSRANTELCLLGTRGKPKRIAKDVRQLVIAPRREHSRKPADVLARVERLVPGPYLDMFSRESRPGWSAWGNEQTKFDRVAA